MASANPLWGTERIRGELLKLGVVVSARSIRRYRRRRRSLPPSQSWRTFLNKHARDILAADLFVVQTLTFQTLYVIFFIGHGRRELLHCGFRSKWITDSGRIGSVIPGFWITPLKGVVARSA